MPNDDVDSSAQDAENTTPKARAKTKTKAKAKAKIKPKAKTKAKANTKLRATASSVPPTGSSRVSKKAPPTKSISSSNRKLFSKEGLLKRKPRSKSGSDRKMQAPTMWLKKLKGSASERIDVVFEQAVKATGAVVDSKTAKKLKKQALSAYRLALKIGKSIVDVNKDGKVDVDDLKLLVDNAIAALEKVDKIDPDLKTALLAGVVACGSMFLIPIIGQTLAIPVFGAATAFFYLKAKLARIGNE